MVKSFCVYENFPKSSLGMFEYLLVPLSIYMNPSAEVLLWWGLTKTFRDTKMLKNKLTFLSLFVGQPLVHFLPVHGHLDQAGSANKRKRLESATGTSTISPTTSWSSVSVVRPVQAGSANKRKRLESASATGASKVVPFAHWPWPILPPLQLHNSTINYPLTHCKTLILSKSQELPF